MDRSEALLLAKEHVKKESNLKHMIAVGGIMRALADSLGEDPVRWEVVGILHDIDFETCHGPEDHTLVARDMLAGVLDHESIEAIMAHNHEHTGVPVDNRLKVGLIASDAASGLVVATALVLPSRKVADVAVRSLVKKYGSKDFAKGVSRERIAMCDQLGLGLEEFLTISLKGMVEVGPEIGL